MNVEVFGLEGVTHEGYKRSTRVIIFVDTGD